MKKILLILIIIILSWVGIQFYRTYYQSLKQNYKVGQKIEKQISEDRQKYSTPIEQETDDSDFDNDGLSKKEENIYLTHTRNPDTDGDGYSDKVEIDKGFAPLTPSENSLNIDLSLIPKVNGIVDCGTNIYCFEKAINQCIAAQANLVTISPVYWEASKSKPYFEMVTQISFKIIGRENQQKTEDRSEDIPCLYQVRLKNSDVYLVHSTLKQEGVSTEDITFFINSTNERQRKLFQSVEEKGTCSKSYKTISFIATAYSHGKKDQAYYNEFIMSSALCF